MALPAELKVNNYQELPDSLKADMPETFFDKFYKHAGDKYVLDIEQSAVPDAPPATVESMIPEGYTAQDPTRALLAEFSAMKAKTQEMEQSAQKAKTQKQKLDAALERIQMMDDNMAAIQHHLRKKELQGELMGLPGLNQAGKELVEAWNLIPNAPNKWVMRENGMRLIESPGQEIPAGGISLEEYKASLSQRSYLFEASGGFNAAPPVVKTEGITKKALREQGPMATVELMQQLAASKFNGDMTKAEAYFNNNIPEG